MTMWNYDYIIHNRLASKVGVKGGVNTEKFFLYQFFYINREVTPSGICLWGGHTFSSLFKGARAPVRV